MKPTYLNRLRVACENPIATSIEFMRVMKNILENLVCIKPESGFGNWKSVRKTIPYIRNKKGCFGYTMGFVMRPEVSSRSAHHSHLIGFGSIPPYLLQISAMSKVLQESIGKALDVMYTSCIPREWHLADLLDKERKVRKIKKEVLNMGSSTSLIAPQKLYKDKKFSIRTCLFCGIHVHSFTCHKGKQGQYYCRMCYPQGLINETKPVGLLKVEKDDEITIKSVDLPHSEFKIEIKNRDLEKEIIPLLEEKPIVWETKRPEIEPMPELDDDICTKENKKKIIDYFEKNLPKNLYNSETKEWLENMDDNELIDMYNFIKEELPMRNGKVVCFNDVIANCTGCNTNVPMLGSVTQSIATCFYLCGYLRKDLVPIEQSIPIFSEARKHIENFKSTVEDSGTIERITKHWLQRILNSSVSRIEFFDTQAAAYLLGMILIL